MLINEFTPIPGYEGLYEINRRGEIYRVEGEHIAKNGRRYFTERRTIKPHISTIGYLRVLLSKKGKQKSYTLHRLLAQIFIPNPHKFSDVNHIDGNKLNNRLSNLEWLSHAENMKHASVNGLMKSGDDFTRTRIKSYELRDILNRIKNGEKIKDIAIEIGCHTHVINRTFKKSKEFKDEWQAWKERGSPKYKEKWGVKGF